MYMQNVEPRIAAACAFLTLKRQHCAIIPFVPVAFGDPDFRRDIWVSNLLKSVKNELKLSFLLKS